MIFDKLVVRGNQSSTLGVTSHVPTRFTHWQYGFSTNGRTRVLIVPMFTVFMLWFMLFSMLSVYSVLSSFVTGCEPVGSSVPFWVPIFLVFFLKYIVFRVMSLTNLVTDKSLLPLLAIDIDPSDVLGLSSPAAYLLRTVGALLLLRQYVFPMLKTDSFCSAGLNLLVSRTRQSPFSTHHCFFCGFDRVILASRKSSFFNKSTASSLHPRTLFCITTGHSNFTLFCIIFANFDFDAVDNSFKVFFGTVAPFGPVTVDLTAVLPVIVFLPTVALLVVRTKVLLFCSTPQLSHSSSIVFSILTLCCLDYFFHLMSPNIGARISHFPDACNPFASLITHVGAFREKNFLLLYFDPALVELLVVYVIYLSYHGLCWVPLPRRCTVDYDFCPSSRVRYRILNGCFPKNQYGLFACS